MSGDNPGTAKCPESLCLYAGVTAIEGNVKRLLGESYPSFIARTDSCAKPLPSVRLWLSLLRSVFAGCCQPLLRNGPSRLYLCYSFLTCLDPYPGCSQGACARYYPQDIGLPRKTIGSALSKIPTATSVGEKVSELQSLLYVQTRKFARHADSSHPRPFGRKRP